MEIELKPRRGMFEVVLDREFYSKSDEIFKHIQTLFGPEPHNNVMWEGHEGSEYSPYTVFQMFGYTHVRFKIEKDAIAFKTWAQGLL